MLWLSVLSHMVQKLILTATIIWLKHKNRPSCYNSCICRSSTEIHTFLWIRQKQCHHRKFSVFFIKKIFLVQIMFARSFTEIPCVVLIPQETLRHGYFWYLNELKLWQSSSLKIQMVSSFEQIMVYAQIHHLISIRPAVAILISDWLKIRFLGISKSKWFLTVQMMWCEVIYNVPSFHLDPEMRHLFPVC